MNHSREQALHAAHALLDKNKIKHVSVDSVEIMLNHQCGGNQTGTDIWVVSYTYMVFQEESAFIYLDDRNDLKLIHILTNHGYLHY